jgi:hypothetical protein
LLDASRLSEVVSERLEGDAFGPSAKRRRVVSMLEDAGSCRCKNSLTDVPQTAVIREGAKLEGQPSRLAALTAWHDE